MAASDWKILTKNKKLLYFDEDKELSAVESFYFVVGADPQIGLKEWYENSKKGLPPPTGRYWLEDMKHTEKAVDCINNLRPRPSFVVVCGDLCNAYPVMYEEMRAQQEKDFKFLMSKIDPTIPLICVCGNHDVGEQPTPDSVAAFRSSFGDDYFSFWRGGVLFLVLNSQYLVDSSEIPEYFSEQESWLESMLHKGKKKGAQIIVFQHVPWFIEHVDEADTYFNIPKSKRKPFLEKLHVAGVTHVFCGHLHYNALSSYKSMEIITTSAISFPLGNDKQGMRVVKVKRTGLEHTYYLLDNFPKNVEL